jgi:hypothetical protein
VDIEEIRRELGRLTKTQIEKLLTNLDHVTFPFQINMSFLKYGNHPITIPKEFYSFLSLHRIPINQDMTISFPDGSTSICYIYQGKAGYGDYYQIKLRHPFTGSGVGVSQFKKGDGVRVELLKAENRPSIRLSRLK